MSTCGPVEFLAGGTLADTNLVNPNVTGGTSNGQTLENATLTGNVTLSPETLALLADQLRAVLGVPAYSDCHGAEVAPDGRVATCVDLVEKVAEATDPDKIAGVFNRRDGTKFTSGATFLTEQEIKEAINVAVAGVDDEDNDHWYKPNALLWDAQTGTLTLTELDQDGAPVTKAAQITGFAHAFEQVSVPGASAGGDESLPLAMHGSRSALLGAPTKYLRVTIQGQAGWVPFYAL
jgi:hypothetical protein